MTEHEKRTGVGSTTSVVVDHSAPDPETAERLLRLLQVKTLGPSPPDAGYERTRRFYLGTGFLPVEEFADRWPGNPCLLMVKPISPR